MTVTETPLAIKTAAAEQLSRALTELQRDHSLTFSEAVAVMQLSLDNTHSDDDMPGGGYVVVN